MEGSPGSQTRTPRLPPSPGLSSGRPPWHLQGLASPKAPWLGVAVRGWVPGGTQGQGRAGWVAPGWANAMKPTINNKCHEANNQQSGWATVGGPCPLSVPTRPWRRAHPHLGGQGRRTGVSGGKAGRAPAAGGRLLLPSLRGAPFSPLAAASRALAGSETAGSREGPPGRAARRPRPEPPHWSGLLPGRSGLAAPVGPSLALPGLRVGSGVPGKGEPWAKPIGCLRGGRVLRQPIGDERGGAWRMAGDARAQRWSQGWVQAGDAQVGSSGAWRCRPSWAELLALFPQFSFSQG